MERRTPTEDPMESQQEEERQRGRTPDPVGSSRERERAALGPLVANMTGPDHSMSQSDSSLSSSDGSQHEELELDFDEYPSWPAWFCSIKGNEFFCEVDEDYISDGFNLSGLASQVPLYDYALDVLTDGSHALKHEVLSAGEEAQVEQSAQVLYGLIHARYIITARGMSRMLEKFKACDFGRCPRVSEGDVSRAAVSARGPFRRGEAERGEAVLSEVRRRILSEERDAWECGRGVLWNDVPAFVSDDVPESASGQEKGQGGGGELRAQSVWVQDQPAGGERWQQRKERDGRWQGLIG